MQLWCKLLPLLVTLNVFLECLPSTCSCSLAALAVQRKDERQIWHCRWKGADLMHCGQPQVLHRAHVAPSQSSRQPSWDQIVQLRKIYDMHSAAACMSNAPCWPSCRFRPAHNKLTTTFDAAALDFSWEPAPPLAAFSCFFALQGLSGCCSVD